MERSLTYLFSRDVQQILNTFTALLQVRIAFFSSHGEELKVGLEKPWCEYCSLVRTRLDLDSLCKSNDIKRMEEAAHLGEAVPYTCHAGLHEVIKPLTFGNETAGYLMIGQFRTQTHPPAGLVSLWKRKYDTPDLKKAYASVPHFSKEKSHYLVSMFDILCNYVAEHQMISMDREKTIHDAVRYMENNIDTPFTLSDAAEFLNLSTSRTAALFQKCYGRGFKEIHNELRVTRAKELLRDQVGYPIQAVAEKTGFKDPLYFSRFFRKHTGMSPSIYRAGEF